MTSSIFSDLLMVAKPKFQCSQHETPSFRTYMFPTLSKIHMFPKLGIQKQNQRVVLFIMVLLILLRATQPNQLYIYQYIRPLRGGFRRREP